MYSAPVSGRVRRVGPPGASWLSVMKVNPSQIVAVAFFRRAKWPRIVMDRARYPACQSWQDRTRALVGRAQCGRCGTQGAGATVIASILAQPRLAQLKTRVVNISRHLS